MVPLKRAVLVAVLAGVSLAVASAQVPRKAEFTVKIATLAPKSSVWYNELAQMASDWRRVSGGRVDMTIYEGGTQGDEGDVIRKIQFNQLQAAAVTAVGIAPIDEAFYAFTTPLFFQSTDELFCVMDRMTPTFEKRLEAKGFVLLSMGYAGWVHAFSRKPVESLADLKRMKVFTSTGDSKTVQWYKDNGFNPIPLASTDMLTALQTGQVDVVPSTPLGVLTLQWYTQAPYMLDIGVAPLPGAQIISKRAWDNLPSDVKPGLLQASRALWTRLQTKVPDSDVRAVAAMEKLEKNKLTVTHVKGTPAQAAFDELARQYTTKARGTWVPDDIFDELIKSRDTCRASAPKTAPTAAPAKPGTTQKPGSKP
jgi:TRAP-type C4-dicarboxylate transport system substrate-binding protein